MSDPELLPCKCGHKPHFSEETVPVFDEFDSHRQPIVQCQCGLRLGPNGSNKEGLALLWNNLMRKE